MKCKEFYKKFERDGNFCEKNPNSARQIEHYIDYCSRHDIEKGSINISALQPLINIEGEMVHDMVLTSLKQRLEKELRPKDVTRKLMFEIIKNCNKHNIRDISYETKKLYNELKQKSGINTNDEIVKLMILYCSSDNYFIEVFCNENKNK